MLEREAPRRTAAQVARALSEAGVGVVPARTLQRHFARLRRPSPAELHDAFLWSASRTVDRRTASVAMFGNHHEVDPALAGARPELVFDLSSWARSRCASRVARWTATWPPGSAVT